MKNNVILNRKLTHIETLMTTIQYYIEIYNKMNFKEQKKIMKELIQVENSLEKINEMFDTFSSKPKSKE